MKRLFLLLFAAAVALRTVTAASFPVTTAADSGDGSLRQAITSANGAAGADTINFNIPSSDPNCDPTSHVCTITPASTLPAITGPVTIDGYTQPNASANTLAVGDNAVLLIELNGTSANGSGLSLGGATGGSTISGLVINRFVNEFEDAAIRVVSGNNVVTGCFIGVDPTANTKLANGGGVRVVTGANNRIGGTTPAARNVISGNNSSTNNAGGSSNIAVTFDGPYPPAVALPTGTIIRGNYIGTNAAGTVSISDPSAFGATDGILISGGTGTIIGGTDADDGVADGKVGARNVISGNLVGISTRFGIYNGDITVEGNFIGVNAAGTAALGNYMEGINFTPYPQDGATFTTNSLTLGGTAAGAGNVIAGQMYGAGVYTNARVLIVQGNRIGTDLSGTLDLGNGGSGLEIPRAFPAYPDSETTIGGVTAAARNIISANGKGGNGGFGINVASPTTTTIEGNFIGTQGDGISPLGNALSGILVNGFAAAVTIGGVDSGEANIVAYNSAADNSFGAAKGGVIVGDDFSMSLGTSISGNVIFANNGLGIDLGGNGPTPNDPGDGDTGPNNLQNFPVLTSASIAGGTASIAGTLESSANTQFTVEF
ncbi:MAG: beta strand repeat-containing protein, partial [Chthoniobacterales bacterium]